MQKTRKRKTTIHKDKTYQHFNATVSPNSFVKVLFSHWRSATNSRGAGIDNWGPVNWLPIQMGGFPGGASGKEPTCQCRTHIGGSLEAPRRRAWPPLQYPCLENPTGGCSPWGRKRAGHSWAGQRIKWESCIELLFLTSRLSACGLEVFVSLVAGNCLDEVGLPRGSHPSLFSCSLLKWSLSLYTDLLQSSFVLVTSYSKAISIW